jgi:arabinose-5-phosphate isomerase
MINTLKNSVVNNDSIIKAAQKTIQVEIQTLEDLVQTIGASFVKIVRLIYESKGRLVVTGIGKSAIVAQKIVATLNSTGTPSLFMHAADAIHGDLGMITAEDVVLCISKSGETPEIKVLIPLARNLGSAIIGMTSKSTSTLGQQADYLLHTPIRHEADPNNLAPTASTTAQMAIGDAVAIALLELRGFTDKDFAKYHPGGALGKQLYLKVSDLYVKNESPKVEPEATIETVILEISSKRLGATAVVNAANQLLGIVTDGDLRRMLAKGISLKNTSALAIMTANPKTILPDTLAVKALNLMRENSITQLIVAENGVYKGILHLHDLIREGIV